jgi:hypothetical protein
VLQGQCIDYETKHHMSRITHFTLASIICDLIHNA